MAEFSGWGGRYVWRYFWFFHLSLTVGLVLMLVATLVLVGVGFGYEAWGAGAAYGIGCGAALPFLFALLVFGFWSVTSRPFLALPEGSVLRAAGAGLRIVGRRPGAVLLVVGTVLIAGIAIALGLWVVQASIDLATSGATAAWGWQFASLLLLPMLVDSALSVFGDAAFTSLAVAEASEVVR
jgi:hypothetical protein